MRSSRWLAVAMLVLMATNAVADPELGDERGGGGAGSDAGKQYNCEREQGMVAVTFKPDTRLEDVITWAMGFTCRSFLYDPRIVATGKKVTIIAPERMTAADAYRAFLAALATIGLTVVEDSGMLRIVEAQTARKEHVPLVSRAHGLSDRDEIVRLAYHPEFATADTIAKTFSTIKSDAGDVATVGGLVIITDYAARIRDMIELSKIVDVSGGGGDAIYTIAVQHADAHKLVDEVEQLLGAAPAIGVGSAAGAAAGATAQPGLAPTKLLVDDRTNTLVMAGSEAAYGRVRALVEHLDVALEVENGQAFHIVPLRAAIAEDIAATLNSSLQVTGVAAGSGAAKPPVAGAGAPTTPPTAVEGKVRVIADKPSNKLVVIAGGHDFVAVRSMIRELDVPRRQVFIDAQILEVDLDNETDLGVSEHGTIPTGNNTGVAVGGVQLPSLSSANPSSLVNATGLIGGIIGAPITATTLLGTSFPSYGLLINMLATSSNTNLLSAPSILALDNDEAKLKVGTNVPYQSGTTVTAAAGVTQSISREDLTLELDIKPHISDGDVVLLEVKHDAKDLGSTTANLGPTWTTRSFETKLLVSDQQSVAIGGLIEEREIRTVTKVPFLGDIPLLGYLFKYDSKIKKKSSLLIVLTPYIIRDKDDLERIRTRKQREHDELTESFSTLAHMKFQPGIDYSRKRGLLEEINQVQLAIDAERADLPALTRVAPVSTGAIPLDTPGTAR